MKTYIKLAFIGATLFGVVVVFCGALYFWYGHNLSGTILIILGFIIEVFSVVTYVEEMSK